MKFQRFCGLAVPALTLVYFIALVAPVSGQSSGTDTGNRHANVAPTPWGDPDLQGTWDFRTITPLERPSEFMGREFLSKEEVAALNEDAATRASSERRGQLTVQRDLDLAYDQFWWDRGTSDGRTSLIIDPSDGRIPFTSAGRERIDARMAQRERPAQGPEDRSPGERCVHHTKAGPPMSAGGYNNHLRLLQTADYVVIVTEQIHDARIIPMDGRPQIAEHIRQWMGSSRGRWEGDVLVVETTHFNGKASYQGSSEYFHLVERFNRVAADTIQYTYTVTDPAIYTRPWTASLGMKPLDGEMFEFACHEGNYGMFGILSGARAEEKGAEAGPRGLR